MYSIPSHAASAVGESDGWQDWPPEGTETGLPAGAEAKLAAPSGKLPGARALDLPTKLSARA
jgi:hypothetical protein